MSRIEIPTRDEIPAESRAVFDQIAVRFGSVPNVMRILSISPSALSGVYTLQTAMGKTLEARIRDHIALAVSQINGCQYCLSSHSFFSAKFAKMTDEEIHLARQGRSKDPKEDAAARFAKKVAETRGKISMEELESVRAAGYTDAEIVEIVTISVQVLLMNFLNNVFDTDIDFPVVEQEAVSS
jgi:uncharacterized peroxidase-related enzyme